MPRFALKIEYHGGPFAGWQRQNAQASVQAAVEAALDRAEPGSAVRQGGGPQGGGPQGGHMIAAAGRTDAGVHATGQVAHCDMARDWDPFRLSEAVNYHLRPLPVAVLACAPVPEDWHARFSACERRYLFRLVARRAPPTVEAGLVWRVPARLDVAAMRAAAAHLTGRHDFTTFRSSMCQAQSPIKTLDALEIEEIALPGGQEIRFHLRARSFLHNQVRSIVGTLERVGAGAWSPDEVAAALAARDRASCGPVCPPDGLYLASVRYPDDPFA